MRHIAAASESQRSDEPCIFCVTASMNRHSTHVQAGPGGSVVKAPAAWDGSPRLAAALPLCMSTCPPPAPVGADIAALLAGCIRASLLPRARPRGRRAGTGRAHWRHTASQEAFSSGVTRLLFMRRTWADAWPDGPRAAAPRAPASAWAGSCDGGGHPQGLAHWFAIQASCLQSQLGLSEGQQGECGRRGANRGLPATWRAPEWRSGGHGTPQCKLRRPAATGVRSRVDRRALPSALRAAAT